MKIDLNSIDKTPTPAETEAETRKSRLDSALADTQKLDGMKNAKFQHKADIEKAAERMTERVQSKLKPSEKAAYLEMLDGRSESAHTRKLILLYLQNPSILDMLTDDPIN